MSAGGAGRLDAEERRVHTRLLHLALGVEESRAYWARVVPGQEPAQQALQAFEERWFGAKSQHRVQVVLRRMRARYDAFPEGLAVLRRWHGMEPGERRMVCHWHLQLEDPLYREFSNGFLNERRDLGLAPFDRDVVVRWVTERFSSRWGPATVVQFASKLLSAASEAGLITPRRDPRRPLVPRVPDAALTYLLYLLRRADHAGSLVDNPYLASVGLHGAALAARMDRLSGISYQRSIDLEDVEWQYPSLGSWAEATL